MCHLPDMLTSVTALNLRNGTYLDRTRLAGESFVVTRNGRRIAVLISADEYETLLRKLEELSAASLPVIEVPHSRQPKEPSTKP